MNEGLRFNKGKIRHDLLEPYAINELAKVFTKGAEKYAPKNWEKGMDWSKVLASLKRHVNAFEQGEDVDKESECYHMAHAAWNALALVSYYKYAPQFDDRNHSYLKIKKIGLDIDGVLADFHLQFCNWCGIEYYDPTHWNDPLIKEKFDTFKKDENFWLNMPVLTPPSEIGFEPHCYITTRTIDPSLTQAWLNNNGYPHAELYSVLERNGSKVDFAKASGIEMFVDDKFENFIDLNKEGILCYLFDSPHNKRYDVGYKRLFNLNDLI